MKRVTVLCLIVLFVVQVSVAAVRGSKAVYTGGSLPIPEKQDGKLDTAGDSMLVFTWDKGKWESPFKGITSIEYGQKAGRRVGAAIALSAVTLAGPLLLFSKKKKHFLTLQVTDAGGQSQAAVFELSKGTYKQTLAALESKSGVKVEYLVEEKKDKKKDKTESK